MSIKVRSHNRRSKRGKIYRVRQHARAGKARAVQRMTQMHPGLSKRDAAHLFNMAFDSIKQDVKKEGKVTVPGFGTFRRKRIGAKPRRQVRNPFTGETVWAKPKPASIKIRFRGGQNFN